MNKNIEHYFFHKKNFLEKSFCENAINELNKNEWEKHDWSTSAGVITKPSEDNEPEIIYDDMFSLDVGKINNLIVDKLQSTISEYIEYLKRPLRNIGHIQLQIKGIGIRNDFGINDIGLIFRTHRDSSIVTFDAG